ncbi:MAG: hypothetical protein LBS80_02055, partial [Tannerella sp.]|nr:hypothetical protein [Tannerella sp.]
MKFIQNKLVVFFIIVTAFSSCENVGKNKEVTTTKPPASFSFVANQCGGNVWYKPDGTIVNGHIDESFGNRDLWPELIENLKRTGGSFSLYAAEIGYMSSENGFLSIVKSEGIPVSVEMPGFTACIPGALLGESELNGKTVDGKNLFSTRYGITHSDNRIDPDEKGWFVTKDGQPFIPDEILFDERIPNLLPQFDADILANTK